MVGEEFLKEAADPGLNHRLTDSDVRDMARELLELREAVNKVWEVASGECQVAMDGVPKIAFGVGLVTCNRQVHPGGQSRRDPIGEKEEAKMEMVETIGRIADDIDSLATGLEIPMPASFHVAQLKEILPDIANRLKIAYVSASGENPWSGGPFDIKTSTER